MPNIPPILSARLKDLKDEKTPLFLFSSVPSYLLPMVLKHLGTTDQKSNRSLLKPNHQYTLSASRQKYISQVGSTLQLRHPEVIGKLFLWFYCLRGEFVTEQQLATTSNKENLRKICSDLYISFIITEKCS